MESQGVARQSTVYNSEAFQQSQSTQVGNIGGNSGINVQRVTDLDIKLPINDQSQQSIVPLNSRKIHQISQETQSLNVTADVIAKFRNRLEQTGNEEDKKQGGNEAEADDTQEPVDLANILSKDDGIYSLLTADDSNQSTFIAVIEQRIKALNNYNSTKKSRNLRKHIAKIQDKLSEFKENPQVKTSLIKLINQCDQDNKFIGLTIKLTKLLLELQQEDTAKSPTVDLIKVEIKGKNFDNTALGKLEKVYRESLSVKHSACIADILAKIADAKDDSSHIYTRAVSLDEYKLTNKQFLQSFIEQKPEIVAELIYDRALMYSSINNKISVLHSKSKDAAEKVLQSAKSMENTPESINNFLKGLKSSQREFFVNNIIGELTEIQINLVEKQMSLPSPDYSLVDKTSQLDSCKNTIDFLKKNYKSYNNYKGYDKKAKPTTELEKLTAHLIKTKAGIIASFLRMQHQLEEPTKKKSENPQRIILLNELSEEDIIKYLQSVKKLDKPIQELLESIVDYVDCIFPYNNGDGSKQDKIKFQNARFDMLKAQQDLLDDEILNIIYLPDYKSKLVDANDFNDMQLKSSIANDIRRNNKAITRNSKGISKNIFIPSMNYEQSDKSRIEENLNEKIKETLNYDFTKEIFHGLKSIFIKNKTEKSETTKKLKDERASRMAEIRADKDSGFISKRGEMVRVVLRQKLMYIIELSKTNPAVFRALVGEIALMVPVFLHIFGKDVMLSTLLKDISKKITDDRFLNGTITDATPIPLFSSDFENNTDIAESMKTVLFLNDTINLFNTYGLSLIDSISTLLPSNSLTKVCETIAKETAKKGGVHLATDVVFYTYSSIKNDKPSSCFPGKSVLENYGLKWITTYIRAYNRIKEAIVDFITKKPNAGKKALKEIATASKTLFFTLLLTSLITLAVYFFFSMPSIVLLLAAIILAINIFHIQVTRQYGITEDDLSLASVVENYYNKHFAVDGHYNNRATKKILKKEFEYISKYNETGSCFDDDDDAKPSEKAGALPVNEVENSDEPIAAENATDDITSTMSAPPPVLDGRSSELIVTDNSCLDYVEVSSEYYDTYTDNLSKNGNLVASELIVTDTSCLDYTEVSREDYDTYTYNLSKNGNLAADENVVAD